MKIILSSFLALTLLMGTIAATPASAKKSGGSGHKSSRGKNHSGSQRNPGRQKNNVPKNPN